MTRAAQLGLLAALLTSGCAADHSNDLEELWGGAAGLAALRSDGPVSVTLLDPAAAPGRVTALGELDVREPARALSAAESRAVRDALGTQQAYLWETAKACLPRWGARLGIRGVSTELDVLLCFECDILSVFRDGERVAGEDFDPVRSDLVRAVKSAFPSDPVVSRLGLSR